MLLTIEKLVYGGDGLARLPADASGRSKTVFLPFVLAGEKVEAKLTGQKSSFARGRVESVIEASPQRVTPGCPYFGSCGGCHYQHASYEQQLQIKEAILRENLRRISKIELEVPVTIHAGGPWHYRNRSRLQVRTKPRFTAGYFRLASHELMPIEECPISSPLINQAIAAIWRSGRANRVPEGVREIEFFANADDSQLLAEIYCSAEIRRAALRTWAEEFTADFPQATGMVAFRSRENPRELPDKCLSIGAEALSYVVPGMTYRVSAGAFFQVNRFLLEDLVHAVTLGQKGDTALDLYAGVGLFSKALACDFKHVFSVESSQPAASDLAYNLPSNAAVIQATTDQFLTGSEKSRRSGPGELIPPLLHTPDLAVVDPPRSGLGENVARLLAKKGAPRIVYVSCDPATLARDLVVLLGEGYAIEQAQLFDLFPQTFHLETVLHLVR